MTTVTHSPYDIAYDPEEADLFREQARERIRRMQGPDTSCPESIAAYWQELATPEGWSEWGTAERIELNEFATPPQPLQPEVDELRFT